jgi:hypothetical protein
VVVWLATRPVPSRARSRPEPVEFELFTAMAVAPSSEQAPSLEALERAPAPAQKTRKNALEPRAAENATAPAEPAPTPAETSASQGSVEAPHEVAVLPPSSADSAAPRRGLNLSPLAAALTMRAEFEAESSCGALAGAASHCGAAGNEASANSAHAEELGTGPRSLIALRKELKLKPKSDGSYAYDAPSFRATVAPDGRVSFDDKIQDLNAIVQHVAGVQVNTAEKRRFMESTAALREQLADAAEAQNQRRAKVTLRHTLEALIADARKSLTQKRAIIFGLWDDCASDASGTEAQAAIEHFVRERLPEGSGLAYSATELAQLNQRRVSRRVFDPYAAGDAGVRPG